MKKVLSFLLTIIMLFTMIPANVFAADGTTVKLVSFMRGDVKDLRSSELLEVQVEGYEGNPRELTYKWTSSLGTYLYIYNSHNMYGINNTYGEYEIYNTGKSVKRSSNVEEDRAGDKTLSLKGFMWASVYGAYTYNGGSASSALKGTVKVEVFDKNGNSLGSDSFSSFKAHSLDSDLDNVVIGLFEGDRMNVLDLLGQSGIVHITCDESKVTSATILSGGEHIAIEDEKKNYNTYNYYITGVKAGNNSTNGDAKLQINIKKTSCKFHYSTSGDANPIVYVFKKPKTATTTTTLTLIDNIDPRCEYFIDGNKGDKQPDGTIVFTGLTPNTDYTVEVRAQYKDGDETKYVYGYVDDTTKPVYQATVKTYLDGTITDISDIHGDDVTLLLSQDGESFIKLKETATGTYEAGVEPGTYFPYHYENEFYHKARNYELVVEHANAELHLHHYSVKYDTNGGAFKAGEEVGTENYSSMSAVNATSNVPVRNGFIFTGWEYNGNVIGSGKQITSSITAPITLKAKWEKAVNVTINVTIDHKTVDGFDPNPTRADLDVDFLEMTTNSPAFVETGDKLHFRKDKVTDENGNAKAYTYSVEDNKSTYTATDYTYTGLLESSTFGVALHKSGYDVGTIEKKQDKLGNWIINIPLTYNPDDFDLDFSVEMADDVPKELYPDAVIVKIAYWNTDTKEWKIISQQETVGSVVKPGVRVDIDPVTGEGSGSYPVWRFDGNKDPYGYRAVVTGFIYEDSTIIVPTEKDHYKDDNTVIVTYTDGNYTATMGDIADGKKFSTSLYGAYYNEDKDAQQGTLHGVISVEKYDVTFDANGGTINGDNTYTETDEYYVPDTDFYVPTFGEHTFKGWYKDPEFKEPAVKNELLTKDITLYAKWDQILTGNVRVAGYYMQNGEIVNVWEVDRANSAVIVLEEITADGEYIVDSQTVNIVWPMGDMIYGISEEYKFKGLDPEKNYRTEVLILNYGTTYQNSTTVFVEDDNYAEDYNADDFKAIYPESS
ncbi:MAG: InlB B-repeat-containing protein, partial [Clostridia bacterium]|nr:InlB B-repeat-containing protein [Clostridia bacterium]